MDSSNNKSDGSNAAPHITNKQEDIMLVKKLPTEAMGKSVGHEIPKFPGRAEAEAKAPKDGKLLKIHPLNRFEDAKEAVGKCGYSVIRCYEEALKNIVNSVVCPTFNVVGEASKDNEKYWIVHTSGYDECHVFEVYISESMGKVIYRKFEEANSRRCRMSRCPQRLQGVVFIPAKFKTIVSACASSIDLQFEVNRTFGK
mmetsp:Transcript_7451/g.9059  ORF Transcript_7451/g.9059 Transcript_7451/m.9059 type:complete len:199 (-) Transcript_7451:69-665(-)|eukprot:jgi/Bigna1/88256/estExt_fgenesh1_pg.C_290183